MSKFFHTVDFPNFEEVQDLANIFQLHEEEVVVDYDGQEVIVLGMPYFMNINMLDIYRNGVFQQLNCFEELSQTEVKFSKEYLKKDDIISVRYRVTNITFGDLVAVPTYIELLKVKDPKINQVALVVDERKFYIYTSNGWEEFLIPYTTQNVGYMFDTEEQMITDTTIRTYNLQEVTYTPGMGGLIIFVDGQRVSPSSFVEVDSKTVTFTTDLPDNSQRIQFLVANTDPWEDNFAHSVKYQYDSSQNIIQESYNFQDVVVKDTLFEYDAKGNIIKETISKNGKVIIKVYTYDSQENLISVKVDVQ